MPLTLTRFGANDPSLPGVLPSMASALSRRRALFGAVALGVAPPAAVPTARAGSWSAAALDELRGRSAAWRENRIRSGIVDGRPTLAQRVAAVRAALAEVTRQVGELEADIRDSG